MEIFLGFQPERACAPETALELAEQAYLRAASGTARAAGALGGSGLTVGIGLTAVIATREEHRGDHRVFCASFTTAGSSLYAVTLTKGVGVTKRAEDERVCADLGLNALLAALGYAPLPVPFVAVSSDTGALARELLLRRPMFQADGRRQRGLPDTAVVLFPGTFDPPHPGHFGMADTLERVTGHRPVFCLTLDPPHKAPIGSVDILQRVKLLRGRDVFFAAGDKLYLDKARRHPGRSFLMGSDALVRMLDPKWCPVQPMLESFQQLGTHFYVVGRDVEVGDQWIDAIGIPAAFRSLFSVLPGRYDVSSSALRQAAGLAGR